MFTEVTAMADGGGSVTCEESGNGLIYPRVRWRGGARTSKRPKAAVWARDSVDVRPSTATTPLGEQRGRRGLAMAREARGARGVGERDGATQGRSKARGPAGQGRPRRAVRRGTVVTGGRERRRE
jgi:hypothetical protein